MKVIYRSVTRWEEIPDWLTPFRSLLDRIKLSNFVIARHQDRAVTLEIDDGVNEHLFGLRVSLLKHHMEEGMIREAGFAEHFERVDGEA